MSSIIFTASPLDIRAHTLNLQALALDQQAAETRARRDTVIRELRASNPKRWTYNALAKAVGLTSSQVTRICKITT